MRVDVWRNQKPDRHFWAFFYFCKRMGDCVSVDRNLDGTVNLTVKRAWVGR